MPLYQRLLGTAEPKIPIHAFQSVMGEWARGKLTGAQAQAVIGAISGAPLDAAEQADAQALVATITSIPVTGSQAAQADGRAQRAMKVHEIDQVLLLADAFAPGYSTEAELRQKLGT
jgi:hypothetical protein